MVLLPRDGQWDLDTMGFSVPGHIFGTGSPVPCLTLHFPCPFLICVISVLESSHMVTTDCKVSAAEFYGQIIASDIMGLVILFFLKTNRKSS